MPASSETVRVRFAPSPTGYLHIGGARTVLFNWLVARKAGGCMVLRIEDTDQTRHVEDSVQKILDDLRWLGLSWDEGPEAGGDYGPYFQSQRLDIYNRYMQQLLEAGHAYYAMETPQELDRMRATAQKEHGGFRYPRPDPLPTIEQGQQAKREGKPVVVRCKMPDEDITVHDSILGDVTLAADQFEDFIIQKSDGYPTYHFACVVDDALMKITHVLRGQEHMMNSHKHVALQRALGFPTPVYGHMPVIFNLDGSKMSKRDKEKAIKASLTPPEIEVHDFRAAGFLPEAILNFIALLGWSTGNDREAYTIDELTQTFSIERIGKTNAKFDRAKLLSFNTNWAARLPEHVLLERLKDYAAINELPMCSASDALLTRLLQACAGFRTFADLQKKIGFLFVEDETIEYDPKAVKKVLAKNENAGFTMLGKTQAMLEALADWTSPSIEALVKKLCESWDTKMGNIAQPIRVAVSGSTVSPSIGETLELLGKDRTLNRIRKCLDQKSTA